MAVSGFNKVIRVKKAGFHMEIKGYGRTLRKLALLKDQKANLQKFLEDEANKVIRTARSIVPVDTGRLKDTHRIFTGGSKKDFVRADIVVGGIFMRGRFVNYAAAVHEGSPTYPARPWLATALALHEPGYRARLKKAIKIPRGR